MKGEVTIVKRNVDTDEITGEYTYENVIVDNTYHTQLGVGSAFGNPPSSPHPPAYRAIGMTEIEILPGINIFALPPGNLGASHIPYNQFISDTYTPATLTTPAIVEMVYTFTPPSTTTRNIRTVYLYQYNDTGSYMRSYVALNPPCTQSITEYLTITYRIFADILTPTSIGGFARGTDATDVHAECAIGRSEFQRGDGFPYTLSTPLAVVEPGPNTYTSFTRFPHSDHATRTTIPRYWKRRLSFSFNRDQYIGNIFKTFGINSWTSINYTDYSNHRCTLRTRAVPENFQYKPVQPIHTHNVNATMPFMDVNALASGNGYLSVDGTNYTEMHNVPSWMRVDISGTGNIGTVRYNYSKRKFIGWGSTNPSAGINTSDYRNGGYNAHAGLIPWFPGDRTNPTKTAAQSKTFTESGTLETVDQLAWYTTEYDGVKILTFDTQRIAIIDIVTGDRIIISSSNLPGFLANAIGQVEVDNDLNVFVACRNTGLYKITNPLSPSRTLTKYTQASHSIPSDSGCYGVCEGYNNSIWAVFDDGITTTTDYGTSWTNYTPTSSPVSFVYTSNGGISNNNWSKVKMIRVDRESPTNQMALVYHNASDGGTTSFPRAYIAWWSTANNGASSPCSYLDGILFSVGGTAKLPYLKCSRYGGKWMAIHLNLSGSGQRQLHPLIYGSTTIPAYLIRDETYDNSAWYKFPQTFTFIYDQHRRPYCLFTGGSNNTISNVYNEDNVVTSRVIHNGNGSAYNTFFIPEKNGGTGWGLAIQYRDGYRTEYSCFLDFIQPYGSNPDPWNGKGSVVSDHVWQTYNWNGANWQLFYNATATDSSTNNYSAPRAGFDMESHEFTGISRLNITPVFTTGNFTNAFTFAATITPRAKSTWQEPNAMLFEIYDPSAPTNQNRIQVFSRRDTSGTYYFSIVQANGTVNNITTSLANDATYRIVVTVNGTTLKVYSNGVQLGSTVTLANTLVLNNSSSQLIAAVGAHTTRSTSFFKGTIRNAQMWNVEWTTTDIANDMVDIYGVISSQPSSAMKCQYQLNEALVETKLTHSGYQLLDEGLQLQFNAGATSPDFQNRDYYTFAVVDGICKDNAMTFSYQYDLFYKPITYDFADVENTGTAPGIMTPAVPSSGSQVTERCLFRDPGTSGTTFLYSPFRVGQCMSTVYTSQTRTAVAAQNLSGDGYFEFKVGYFYNTSGANYEPFVGLSTDSNYAGTNLAYTFRFKSGVDRNVDISESGTIRLSTTYLLGDTFKIEKNGTTVGYYKNNVLIYTSTVASSGALYPKFSYPTFSHNHVALVDIMINYTQPAYILDIGNSVALTGRYDPDFLTFDDEISAYEVTLNGVPAPVSVISTYNFINTMPVPAAGAVNIEPSLGIIVFNPADAGKTVTIKSPLILDK